LGLAAKGFGQCPPMGPRIGYCQKQSAPLYPAIKRNDGVSVAFCEGLYRPSTKRVHFKFSLLLLLVVAFGRGFSTFVLIQKWSKKSRLHKKP
jgi:hypothetical protein